MVGFSFWKACARGAGMFVGIFAVPMLFNLFLAWTLRDQLATSKRVQMQMATQARELKVAVDTLTAKTASITEALKVQARDLNASLEQTRVSERQLHAELAMMLLATDDSAQGRYDLLMRLKALEEQP